MWAWTAWSVTPRVRSRVAQGGHDIPSERIQERYVQSRLNLIRLLPRLTELFALATAWKLSPSRYRLDLNWLLT